jgi:lipopolysaccharide exporter
MAPGWLGRARAAALQGRGTGAIFAGNLATMAISTLSTAYVARRIGPSTYGLVADALAFLQFFILLADAGLSQWVIREAVRDPVGMPGLYRRALSLRLVLSAAAVVACAAVAGALYPTPQAALAWVLAPSLLSIGFGSLLLTRYNVRHEFGAYAGIRVLDAAINATLLVGTVLVAHDARAVAAATVAGSISYWTVVSLLVARREPGLVGAAPRLDWALLRPALWFGAAGLVAYGAGRASIVVVGATVDAPHLGFYAAGFRLVDPIVFLATAIMTANFPRSVLAYHGQAVPGRQVLASMARHGALGLAATLVGLVAAPPVIGLVLGPRFAASIPVFRILLWLFPLAMVTIPTSLLADATGHQRLHFVNGVLIMATNLGLLLALTPRWGIEGAAWAVVAGSLVGAVAGIPLILWATSRAGVVWWS